MAMPTAESELDFRNPFELLVAVVLSAQCTDKRVNLTTPALFAAYPDAAAMSKATVEEIYEYFRKEAESDSLADAMSDLGGDYDELEVRLVRIKFLCEVAN